MTEIQEKLLKAEKEMRDAKTAFDKTKNTKTGLHSPTSADRYAAALRRVTQLRALVDVDVDNLADAC